jgi:hypothetical protein
VLGRTVTRFASYGKLAAPYLTSASKPSRQALVPMVKMLPMRHDCHGLRYLAGFPCLRAKLDNLSALLPPRPFQGFPENRRNVKLDHLCHDYPFFSLQTFAHGALPFVRNYSVLESRSRSLSKTAPETGHRSSDLSRVNWAYAPSIINWSTAPTLTF